MSSFVHKIARSLRCVAVKIHNSIWQQVLENFIPKVATEDRQS
jgi:hypothetical protein